jgi:hypothetical protein
MPETPCPNVDEVIAICKRLSPQDQQKVRQSLADSSGDWITLREAADLLDKNKSQVCRAAQQGKLLTNGQKGRKLRIDKESVIRMGVKDLIRFLGKIHKETPEMRRFLFSKYPMLRDCYKWKYKSE